MKSTLEIINNQSNISSDLAMKIRTQVIEYAGFKMSPLIISVILNKFDIVNTLLENKADIHAKTILLRESDRRFAEDGLESIHHSAKNGNLELFQLLESFGADINKPTKECNMTPFFYSIASKNYELVKYISKKHSNRTHTMSTGSNAINYALSSFSTNEIIEFLIENNYDVNNIGPGLWTPLLSAVAKERYDIAELLIDNNADIKAKTEAGWDINYLAKDKEWTERIKQNYS